MRRYRIISHAAFLQPPGPEVRGSASRRKRAGGTDGFTVVELVVVLAITGILAALAAPRFFGQRPFDERAWYDEVTGALRYAQKVAVASGCPVRVTLNAADYRLGQQAASAGHCDGADAAYASPVRLPDGQTMTGTAPAGVTVAPSFTVTFDALGGTDLAANQAATVGVHSFTVQAGSGLVQTP